MDVFIAPANTGLDLRLRRVTLGLTQVALARQAGVSRRRIAEVEGSIRPTPEAIRRYLVALELADAAAILARAEALG